MTVKSRQQLGRTDQRPPVVIDDSDAISVDALVNGDPRQVLELLGQVPSWTAAIYRTSYHLHQNMHAWARRQILALDAARFGDRALSARILATPVPGEPDAEWTVDWATGALVEPRMGGTIDGLDPVRAVAPVVIDGRPHVVSGDEGGLARLWDVVTGRPVGEPMECGDDTWVTSVAMLEINGRPHAVTAGTDENVRAWDLTTCRKAGTHKARFDWNTSMTAATTGGHAYVLTSYSDGGTQEGLIQGRDLTTGATLRCPDNEGLAALATVLIDGRAHAVAGFADGSVWIWDVATGDLVRRGPARP